MPTTLGFEELRAAVAGTASAFRRRLRLQPAGGPGTKVYPPTYLGAVYALERRLIDGERKLCVLLDSVPSQANRMEEALQRAVDEGRLQLPLVVVDFTGQDLLRDVGRISSLEAPHRVVDAILRDSVIGDDGRPFRDSEVGRRLNEASLRNATPVFELSPTSLVFGMWDSHGPRGGLGAKFERTIASEIVAVDVEPGAKTAGRIDPLGILAESATVYRAQDGGWTLEEAEAAHDENGAPVRVGQRGRPSEIGHGNVAPTVSGPVASSPGAEPGAGGVTMAYALQTTVLSLPALRRLRFPLDGQPGSPDVDVAARTALAALGLAAATLAAEDGYDLRSGCVLVPEGPAAWELLDRPGEAPRTFELDGRTALLLLDEAVEAAKGAGVPWRTEPIVLRPSAKLIELVRRSQELEIAAGAA